MFLELPTDIRILAIAHAKRHPDDWLNRQNTLIVARLSVVTPARTHGESQTQWLPVGEQSTHGTLMCECKTCL
jgi:hypothetical protein